MSVQGHGLPHILLFCVLRGPVFGTSANGLWAATRNVGADDDGDDEDDEDDDGGDGGDDEDEEEEEEEEDDQGANDVVGDNTDIDLNTEGVVVLTAVLESISKRLMTSAAEAARKQGSNVVMPKHLLSAATADEPLHQLLLSRYDRVVIIVYQVC